MNNVHKQNTLLSLATKSFTMCSSFTHSHKLARSTVIAIYGVLFLDHAHIHTPKGQCKCSVFSKDALTTREAEVRTADPGISGQLLFPI